MLPPDWFSAAFKADPTGKLAHGIELIEKYREALYRQHGLIFDAWRAKDFTQALAQLHFFLISLDRMNDGLAMVAEKVGGAVAAFIATRNFEDYTDARNHFEHLDDRLFGTKRNAPEPITENGATRLLHYGLSGNQQFAWGKKRIDISDKFLAEYQRYVAQCLDLTKAAFNL
ncbi:hypothetical protein [Mesorhizobium sp. M1E.F.Ca.ET.041.01.1.1]|uniref:hypothetical protein n=1 Tax=Mesorhizobium sp. M1E.F.Ca.ET.041.01.1.1 TaxID=2496759 RepID=UPI000FCB3A95|nr:hypothetical protein [Mesorhizobium sp. M1E.F.Ca.ET.041.01.1.1]RUW22095.1 hypothetical protein EOA38_31430 [Mesorhizobium sp. M1E.F.Ca.ET.041.01.1.1]RWD92529.1 MAG: hypothetical protein EOS38_01480 [Mesorhizobium sp.]